MLGRLRFLGCLAVLVCASAPALPAQSTPALPRIIDVEGGAMRVWAAGFEQRKSGSPVVVLEAGAGEGLDNWKPVFAEIARVAPVIAYDRRGIGGSAPDTVKPTLRRVAQSLHALLQKLNVGPPYILIGHSWGGFLTRAYFDQYDQEVAGLIFLDAMNPGLLTREDRAKKAPPEERETVLAPPTLPEIPPDTPRGLRAEYEVVGAEMVKDFPEFRSLRTPSGVPVVVVHAAPPGRMKGRTVADLFEDNRLAELALSSPKGLVIAAAHVGHMVHRDDPMLVVHLVEHVLKYAPQSPAK
jgi:pimeloyl-ACP methyl ester carboxylesterase